MGASISNPFGKCVDAENIETGSPASERKPMIQKIPVTITINEKEYKSEIEPRMLLSDFLRHSLAATGTHVGCEHGVCGACTVLLDGEPVRSCLMKAEAAVGVDGMFIETHPDPANALSDGPNMIPLQQRTC